MSRLRILHTTTYRYAQPVRFGMHRLVLRPREGHDVQVENHVIKTTPDGEISWHRDLFGNSIALARFTGEADLLEIVNDVTVSKRDLHGLSDLWETLPVLLPPDYSELETAVLDGYRAPVYGRECRALLEWAEATFHPKPGMDGAGLVRTVMDWIHQSIQYQQREDRGVQTPMETLRLLSGSCRDMATLMLETVRALGLAGRFASGYLHTASSTAGRASTHAWMEVYFPDHGWFGWDPTLGEVTSLKHILTGVSSHPRGVMPISGAWSGPADAYLDLTVSVKIERLPPQILQL